MLYEKIMGVSKALGVLDGQVNSEQWELIQLAKNELMDAADQVREMESSANVVPDRRHDEEPLSHSYPRATAAASH